jgi:hypothetical protein
LPPFTKEKIMPVIGVGAGIPGTSIGTGVRVGFQTSGEKQADTATRLSEAAERDRVSDTAPRQVETKLDALVKSDGLQRFR